MDGYQAALAIGAIITALLVRKDRKALLWVGLGAASFIITTFYARTGGWHPPFFNGLVDTSVAIAVFMLARRRWEIGLFVLYQLSVLVSFFTFVRVIDQHTTYVIALEIINWLALALILTMTRARGFTNGMATWWPARSHLRRAVLALSSARAPHPLRRR